jgi:hypothetical protein
MTSSTLPTIPNPVTETTFPDGNRSLVGIDTDSG